MSSVLVRALDAHVRIEAPDPVTAVFRDVLADLIDDDCAAGGVEIVWHPTEGGRYRVALGGSGSSITDVGGGVAESIVRINQAAATSVASDRAVLHAGAFDVGGSAVAVTGASGAGKSTLVAAAVLAGHGYLADEVCAVDPVDASVRPYHRPIGLRPNGAAAIGIPIPVHAQNAFSDVYPWRVGSRGALASSGPLRLLALVDRRSGPVEITELEPADALVMLTNLSLGTDGVEREMFRRLDRLVREVRVVTVGYGDSFAAVGALAELVA